MCAHENGSISLWNYKSNAKPQQVSVPHGENLYLGLFGRVIEEPCDTILSELGGLFVV